LKRLLKPRLDLAAHTRDSTLMPKSFTVEEANRTLPLVSKIVADLVHAHQSWEDKVREFELATVGSSPDRPDAIAELLQAEAQRLAVEIEGYVSELADLGVICKGMDTGLVDFPGERDGRQVYYCWMLGEPGVQYWHELDTGFAGRQRVESLTLTESR
jgi:hypothetical protein